MSLCRKMALINLLLWLAIFFLPFAFALANEPPFACDETNPQSKSFPFCQKSLPINQRVHDLVSRLTVDEKISQLINTAPAIPRLGIPAYEWWSEALHGVAYAGPGINLSSGAIRLVTSFPQVIVSASTFDNRLWYRIGAVVGKEARAVYNEGQAKGMTFWSPNINIFRDPRWGRGQETPGEDPLVTSKYAVSFVRGLQGDSYEGGLLKNGQLQASACCKHFIANDLDRWKGVLRYSFNARVSKQDLADTFEPPFRSCVVEGKASGIMCAYNQVNGVPNCADYSLLTETVRKEWDFHGYVTSDCGAVAVMYTDQKYTKLPEDTVADVLKAGMDVDCGVYMMNYTKSALSQKKITEHNIDRALHNLFSVRMRLGLFNGNPKYNIYGNIGPDQVCTKEHQDLALEAARNGIVLLKNSARHLPLSKKISSLAVIGPDADDAYLLRGGYEGPGCKFLSVLDSLKSYVSNTVYHKGCDSANCTYAAINDAVNVAKQADYVVLVMGLNRTLEFEDHDREDLSLPGYQERLISAVSKAAKKPVVLVLICGGPVDVSFAKHDPKVGSILWGGYPGESGGIAVTEIIFGEHNPGGRLPMTWYPKDFIKIPMTDMRMRPDRSSGYPGRTYRFYTGRKVFEFGYGLSYTTYKYNFTTVTQETVYMNQFTTVQAATECSTGVRYLSVFELGTDSCEKAQFSAKVGVENEGEMDGRHPVLLFIKPKKHREGNPLKQLVGFQSISLKAGSRTEVEFTVSPCQDLSITNKDGLKVIEEGSYSLVVGDKEYSIDVGL